MEQTISHRLAAALTPATLTVLIFSNEQLPTLKQDTNQRRLAQAFDNSYYINLDSRLLPFLTIEENFFVGIKRKQVAHYAKKLFQWQHFFKMDPAINQAYPADVNHDRLVIIQLIRAFILKKEVIFIDDIELSLNEEFLASLMPILKKIAVESEVSIVLLTTKSDLATQFKLETIQADSII